MFLINSVGKICENWNSQIWKGLFRKERYEGKLILIFLTEVNLDKKIHLGTTFNKPGNSKSSDGLFFNS